jgi:hypothetical protein
MSFAAILAVYLVSRLKVFQESFRILEEHRIGSKPKGKAELRRYRKLKATIRRARRNVMLLFLIHLAVFVITYTLAIVITALIVPESEQLVTIPVALPLFSARNAQGYYTTHILFITFTAYLAPNYLLVRAVRPSRKISVKFKNKLSVK